jgi:hypothetical protein
MGNLQTRPKTKIKTIKKTQRPQVKTESPGVENIEHDWEGKKDVHIQQWGKRYTYTTVGGK